MIGMKGLLYGLGASVLALIGLAFFGKLRFGHGLGDLYVISAVVFFWIVGLLLILLMRGKGVYRLVALLYLLLLVYLILKITVLSGPECGNCCIC